MAVPGIRDMETAVESFLDSEDGDRFFTLSELSSRIAKELGAVEDKEGVKAVERETELIIGSREDLLLSGDNVYPRKTFFRKTKFKIVPTAFELEKNLLFPGARFAPFCSPEIFHDAYKVMDNTSGASLPILSVQAAFRDFAMPSLLLGRSGLIDSLVAENDENRMRLRAASSIEHAILTLSAFDMTAFYREHRFQQGDALIATVEDWEQCVFSLEYRAYPDLPGKAKQDEWLHKFETALLQVCIHDTDYWEIPDQISYAYLNAYENHADLRQKPYLALEEYQLRMQEISIRKDGPDWLLVPGDDVRDPGSELDFARHRQEHENEKASCSCQDHHGKHEHGTASSCHCSHDAAETEENLVEDIHPEEFSVSSGVLDSLEAILQDVHAPVNEIEVCALIQDALANGEENFESFRSRLLDFLELKFADEAQETAFTNYLEDCWEIAREYFNPSIDQEKEPLRVRLLDLTRERIEAAVNLLDFFRNAVPEELAEDMRIIHRDIVETLSLLNTDARLPEGAEEQLELRVGDLEEAWEIFMEKMADRMKKR